MFIWTARAKPFSCTSESPARAFAGSDHQPSTPKKLAGQEVDVPLNMTQRASTAIFEPYPSSEYAKRQAQLTPVTKAPDPDYAHPRRSPLPSAGEIDAALQRKYGRGFGRSLS
jgi:hypothetical protein